MGTKLLEEYEKSQEEKEKKERFEKVRDWIAEAMLRHPRAGTMKEVKISWRAEGEEDEEILILMEVRSYGLRREITYGFPLRALEREHEQGQPFVLPESRFRRAPNETFAFDRLPGTIYYLPGSMRQPVVYDKKTRRRHRELEFIVFDDPKLESSRYALIRVEMPYEAMQASLDDPNSELLALLGREDIVWQRWDNEEPVGSTDKELELVVDLHEAWKHGRFRFDEMPNWQAATER